MEELWHHLTARVPSHSALDDATKAFLWRSFLRPGQKEVQFFELPEGRSLPSVEEEEEGLSCPSFYRYSPVCDQEREVVGSCAAYSTRQDCTTHLKETTPSLLQVEERCVCVYACGARACVCVLAQLAPPHAPGMAVVWCWLGPRP